MKFTILPEDIITYFVTQIAFNKTKVIKRSFPIIREFLIHLCGLPQKTFVANYINTKFGVICEQNLTNVCIALSVLNVKKYNVFQYLDNALREETLIAQDELIRFVLQCNSDTVNKSAISSLQNIPE